MDRWCGRGCSNPPHGSGPETSKWSISKTSLNMYREWISSLLIPLPMAYRFRTPIVIFYKTFTGQPRSQSSVEPESRKLGADGSVEY